MRLFLRKKKYAPNYEGVVYFPYMRGYRISLEATRWLAKHVRVAGYGYGLDSHLTVHYISDGTPPPLPEDEIPE